MPAMTSEELRAHYGDLTAADVARLDDAAAGLGLDTERLMEHAGWQVARCLCLIRGPEPCRVAIVSGGGNNGGDGVVAARLLSTWGFATRLLVYADPSRLSEIFRARVEVARHCGVDVTVTRDVAEMGNALRESDAAVDALLGSGLSGPPRPDTHAVIAALSGHPMTLAVDVPSGLDSTTGSADVCVRAEATCTLASMKRGLWTPSGRAAAGRLFVADIGMPREAWSACDLTRPMVGEGRIDEVPAAWP